MSVFQQSLMWFRWWAGDYTGGQPSAARSTDMVIHRAVEFSSENYSRTWTGLSGDGSDKDTAAW